jgi:hypothetical protein
MTEGKKCPACGHLCYVPDREGKCCICHGEPKEAK